MNYPPVVSVEQVAQWLECEPKHVENLLRAAELPGVKMGRGWVIPFEAFHTHINNLARKNVENIKFPPLPAVQQPKPGRKRNCSGMLN